MNEDREEDQQSLGNEPMGAFPTRSLPDSPEELGTQIGRYKLLSILGEGGFGIVYLAEQKHPIRRQVALKIIKPGMDSKQVIRRFEAERQALALLDHPNIASVFDAGTTEKNLPYFVMEYVKGAAITEFCDHNKLSVEERLELFVRVCEAIQHAHHKGIIHRDIKPSNILVSKQDNKAVPKVIDFGVAKAISQPLTERTLFTEQGQLVGTPEYMSPEQAGLTSDDVDRRSDIYSLGVLLYELLSGTLPFDPRTLRQAAFDEIMRIIREEDPPRPSIRLSDLKEEGREIAKNRSIQVVTLAKRLRRELEWIPMKAIRKEPDRRYRTAAEFADDIRNYLNGDPLTAGPESVLYRAKKLARKHTSSIVGVTAVLAVLTTGLATTLYFRERAARAQRGQTGEGKTFAPTEVKSAEGAAEEQDNVVYFTWTEKTQMTHATASGAAAAVGEMIYVFGGHNEPPSPPYGRICEAYNTLTDKWMSIKDLPHVDGRYGLSAIVVGGKIYTFGGTNTIGSANNNNIDEYDPATDTWVKYKARLPISVARVALAGYDGKIYCFGGSFYRSRDPDADDVYEYDVSTNSVSQKANMPTARTCAFAATVGDEIYVIGGYSHYPNRELDVVEVYDPVADRWSTGRYAPMPTGGGVVGAVLNNKIYLNVNKTALLYEYDPYTNSWTSARPMTTARSGQCMVANDKLYVMGGWLPAGPMTSSVEVGARPHAGPVAYWSFDNPDAPGYDDSGNGNNGSPVGGVAETAGVLGRAIHLDGTGYIKIPDNPSIDLPGANCTISAFVRVDQSSEDFGVVSKESSSSYASTIAYEFHVGGSTVRDSLRFAISNGISINSVEHKGTNLRDSVWHHIATTCSGPGRKIRIYRDGIQIAENDQTLSRINDISEPVLIGAFRWNVPPGILRKMTGSIDEVRIYDRALSAREVKDLADILPK